MDVRQITLVVMLGLFWPGMTLGAQSAALPMTPSPIGYGSVQVRPEPVLIPNPGYTKSAFQAGIEGLVAVDVVVDGAGEVASARVARSSLDRNLDAAAVSAARLARFTPGWHNGSPVPVRLVLQYFFTRSGPTFYTTVTMPEADTRNDIGTLPEPVSVPDPADCDSVAWLRLTCAVVIAARVDSLGSVVETNVASSSGNQLVDRKAQEFALKAKFSPGTACGRPTASLVKVEYEFHKFRTYVSHRRILPGEWGGDDIAPTAQQQSAR
jgi:TonB family protein